MQKGSKREGVLHVGFDGLHGDGVRHSGYMHKEKENNNIFFFRKRMREIITNLTQNKMRRKEVKIKVIVINTKLSRSCYVMD